jgi:hypothetical protein
MTCDIKRDADGFPIEFRCGPPPKPKDHECDDDGPMVEIDDGMGIVCTVTCSICGRPAFNMWDMW